MGGWGDALAESRLGGHDLRIGPVGRRMVSDRGKLGIPLGFSGIPLFEFFEGEEEAEAAILQRKRNFLKTSRMLQFVRAEHSTNPALRKKI